MGIVKNVLALIGLFAIITTASEIAMKEKAKSETKETV